MRKKKIFIGCSSEELGLAHEAKKLLEPEFEAIIWNEPIWDKATFKINDNILNSLLKAGLKFDFGLMLGTTDDKIISRGKEVLQPRDNVIFELGLFMGRLGKQKCAFVVDKELNVLSDAKGIVLENFDREDPSSFTQAISKARDFFTHQNDSSINFFPSSTLASVYFENLIVPTCKHLIKNHGFDHDNLKYKECHLNIIIPKKIGADLNIQFENMKRKFSTQSVSFHYEGRPRFINLETEIKENKLIFMDVPTILTGINYSIRHLLPDDFNSMNSDYESILNRELERFCSTLKNLITKNEFEDIVSLQKIES